MYTMLGSGKSSLANESEMAGNGRERVQIIQAFPNLWSQITRAASNRWVEGVEKIGGVR